MSYIVNQARVYHSGHVKGIKMLNHEQEDKIIEQALSILTSRLKVKGKKFNSSHTVKAYLRLQLEQKEREHFAVLFLDNQNCLIQYKVLFTGTINSAAVYPREIIKEALQCNAASVILSHNHPSGNPEPSHEDISLTKKLLSALQLVDIRLLDHMIVGHNEIVSMQSLDLF